jgi:hypothetical protein
MDMLKIKCPFCGIDALVDPESRGSSVFCPGCGGQMRYDGTAMSPPSGSAVPRPQIVPPTPPAES